MGGRDARIEFRAAQTATQLRLADPAIAEKQDFDLRVESLSGLKVLVMGADLIHDVLPFMFAADLGREMVVLQL